MVNNLLKLITPDILVQYIKANPRLVIDTFNRFEAFNTFTNALSTEQQVSISNNLHRIHEFVKSETGKDMISITVDEFTKFVK
jgi:hypothetical protein